MNITIASKFNYLLNMNVPALYLCSAAGKRISTGYIRLQGAVGGEREGFQRNQANFNCWHIFCLNCM